ncbi:hypothetical protein CC86DRAFT_469777 [Ophiobolus disseminans]|uniref:BZIP domain-containing protein n=1 Tax=Ophiobolus disseminans TaxID=1469910 RepID=A0A6A6ZPQ9_9PLEO|nr:hypothetical protein CC86DRAFT_469777 [Ophiobolus disseminans]
MSTVTTPTSTSSDNASDTAPSQRKPRVSAEHTLNRVRENQRRHRARQRDHVASLELKLAETEQLLAEARAEIATLKAHQEATNSVCRDRHLEMPEDSVSFDSSEENERSNKHSELATTIDNGPGPHFQYLGNPDLSLLGNAIDISPAFIIDINSLQLPSPVPTTGDVEVFGGPPPCCSDTDSVPLLDEPVDLECSTCKTKPPPDPSESTTLCAQAFVLISQQNFRNLDPDTIRMWLAQGLRRAQREGEGCRVENGALMRLLDYMSGIYIPKPCNQSQYGLELIDPGLPGKLVVLLLDTGDNDEGPFVLSTGGFVTAFSVGNSISPEPLYLPVHRNCVTIARKIITFVNPTASTDTASPMIDSLEKLWTVRYRRIPAGGTVMMIHEPHDYLGGHGARNVCWDPRDNPGDADILEADPPTGGWTDALLRNLRPLPEFLARNTETSPIQNIPWLWDVDEKAVAAKQESGVWDWALLEHQILAPLLHNLEDKNLDIPLELRNRGRIWHIHERARVDDVAIHQRLQQALRCQGV